MGNVAGSWNAATQTHKMRSFLQRANHITTQKQRIVSAKAEVQANIDKLQEEALIEGACGLPNLMTTAEKFTTEELQELSDLLQSREYSTERVNAMDSSPVEPTVEEINELNRLEADLLPPSADNDLPPPWWAIDIAVNRDEWCNAALYDESKDPEKMYLMLS